MRKLASIQRVLGVSPIEGADKIEVAQVLGWQVVVRKGEFAPGQLVVWYELDSFLNGDDPRYASFSERFSNFGTLRGMRLKTIRLRKQISQGLILPISNFPEIGTHVAEGDDVTELLGVVKWESAEETKSNAGNSINKEAGAKPFPAFIRKTDQERIQNMIGQLDRIQDETFEVSVKLDGSSMTVFHMNPKSKHFSFALEDVRLRKHRKMKGIRKWLYGIGMKFNLLPNPEFVNGVCSRNIQMGPGDSNNFANYAREHNMLEGLANLNMNIAVQGELIAPSIQNNYEKVSGFEYHVYDIFDIDKQEYLVPSVARQITADLGLSYVPVLHESVTLGGLFGHANVDASNMVKRILDYAEGPGMNPGVKREGVVFKSNNSPVSFKAISNSYLLSKKD